MTDLSRVLIYGAYGYTGDLTARLAKEKGYTPILAGRSADKLAPLAEELGLDWRTFPLDDAAKLDEGLEDIDLVIHCAGPFSKTSAPMLAACLRNKVHYTDITGEISVFEACAARDDDAREAGIVVMPGTGFDVVPSDCLAAYLHSRLPEATHLTLAFQNRGGGASHGTMATALESMARPNRVRRDGVITEIPMGKLRREFDFGRGPRPAMSIPWGDVSTAFRSTGIPNIEVFRAMSKKTIRAARLNGVLGLTNLGFVQRRSKARLAAMPAGPSAERRDGAEVILHGEARTSSARVAARLRVGEGYELTAATSLEIARRLLEEDHPPGFHTPSMLFGADFILEFDGAERKDVP
jgi:short subunit dehydrogenase-like uncharacterized protein